ncbi:G-protein-like protein coupled receptor [Amylocarpus encephaloides]|uniref:G-protein-like protein coupled receptor n=1 Tax=Amylocarpus encephaloides TaxID=45428 RepID=A0A9P7YCV4_9HELO|nr:G-protein-like protein coupled receptor [Amylocarpus encephaloides]
MSSSKPASVPLTHTEVETLIAIERVTASISVFATLILIGTFIFIKDFRTLSNTLIFYASFANIFANVAALIGGSALSHENGALCQFQGFLLEMFMQSDPMWSCAMAVNVYLVFFHRYDSHRLKRLYWVYGVVCYGLPFIPAMFCLFYRTHKRGKMYGNATLWCWIDGNWAPVRIYSYYAPIWIAILMALVIYVRVGIEIFQKRNQLKVADTGNLSGSNDIRPTTFAGTRTTEIQVTTDLWKPPLVTPPSPIAQPGQKRSGSLRGQTELEPNEQYSITICAHNDPLTRLRGNTFGLRGSNVGAPIDKIKWAYTKVAILFAISILVTWVPASINRIHGLVCPARPSFGLNVGSAVVLPLQGFWNAIIYFATSLGICRKVWRRWRSRGETKEVGGGKGFGARKGLVKGKGLEKETASTVEFSEHKSVGSLGDSF